MKEELDAPFCSQPLLRCMPLLGDNQVVAGAIKQFLQSWAELLNSQPSQSGVDGPPRGSRRRAERARPLLERGECVYMLGAEPAASSQLVSALRLTTCSPLLPREGTTALGTSRGSRPSHKAS